MFTFKEKPKKKSQPKEIQLKNSKVTKDVTSVQNLKNPKDVISIPKPKDVISSTPKKKFKPKIKNTKSVSRPILKDILTLTDLVETFKKENPLSKLYTPTRLLHCSKWSQRACRDSNASFNILNNLLHELGEKDKDTTLRFIKKRTSK